MIEKEFRYTVDELSEQHFEMNNKKNYGRIPVRIKRGFKHAARSAKELRWIVISSTLIVPNKRSCNYDWQIKNLLILKL